jgi:hypothetical protein
MAPRPIACMLSAALAVGGCMFPSFDGMGGSGDPEAKANRSGTVPGDPGADASTTATPEASTTTTADAATPDSGASAPAKNFACGSSLRCALGSEVCCGHTIDTECRSATASANDCDGVTHCGDTRDCAGTGEQCCYNTNTKLGTCRTGCTGSSDLIVCEPGNATCPGSKKCNGRYFGLAYCI